MREELGFQRRHMFRNRKSAVEGDPGKVAVGLKLRRFGWRLAWWGSTEKKASYLLGLRGRH